MLLFAGDNAAASNASTGNGTGDAGFGEFQPCPRTPISWPENWHYGINGVNAWFWQRGAYEVAEWWVYVRPGKGKNSELAVWSVFRLIPVADDPSRKILRLQNQALLPHARDPPTFFFEKMPSIEGVAQLCLQCCYRCMEMAVELLSDGILRHDCPVARLPM